jgi:PTH1 family peptidyl-tRNA hydrolase
MPASVSAPRLVVGLGNPGDEYAETRHNAGVWFCARLAARLGAKFSFEARFHGLVARDAGLTLLLPQTYMNHSGQALGALARFYRVAPAAILVIHDELDLPPGQTRLKFSGGLRGHNGLKDISAHLGSQDYWRLRIGIGHPGDRNEVVDYVLMPPRREERALIEASIERALDAWPMIARGDWEKATQRINTRPAALQPPKDTTP